MAVTLRLSRHGANKAPFYHLVATDSRDKRDGKFIETVGTYDPRSKELKLKAGRVEHWLSKGATQSATVRQLLKKQRKSAAAAA